MPIPANPLLSDLVLEGIKQAGENNPSAALVTRATNEWIEEIKNDIWMLAKKPKILHVTAYTTINMGQSRYAYPSDYSSDLTLTLLYGTGQGAAQGGSTNTIVLAASDKNTAAVIGKEILMLSGTSAGSFAQIVTYDPTTKTAGMVPNWATAPVSGDTYMIIDVEYPVETRPVFDWDARIKLIAPQLPQYIYPIGDDQQGYFIFNAPPDKTYGARLRYYADFSQVDSSSTLMSVIYRKWRNIFIEGIRQKKLNDENDDRGPDSLMRYQKNLMSLIYREIYGMDISNITDRVMDYQ